MYAQPAAVHSMAGASIGTKLLASWVVTAGASSTSTARPQQRRGTHRPPVAQRGDLLVGGPEELAQGGKRPGLRLRGLLAELEMQQRHAWLCRARAAATAESSPPLISTTVIFVGMMSRPR